MEEAYTPFLLLSYVSSCNPPLSRQLAYLLYTCYTQREKRKTKREVRKLSEPGREYNTI
jgi:hypothetical protein